MAVVPAVIESPVETFRALSDPVRLAIIEHLSARDDATINELAALFPISLQAVSRHVKVLEAAGVVSQRRVGRQRPVRLEPEPVTDATSWLAARLAHLEARYARVDELLTRIQETDPS